MRILREGQLIRRYVFTYDSNSPIFPNLTWSAGGKTPALMQVQEFGWDGSSLPPVSFTYGDNLHLTRAENGYGGKVEFNYELWNDLRAPESAVSDTQFGKIGQPCHGSADSNAPWYARPGTNSSVICEQNNNNYPNSLLVRGEAWMKLPERLTRPGGRYHLYVRAISYTSVTAGITGGDINQDQYGQTYTGNGYTRHRRHRGPDSGGGRGVRAVQVRRCDAKLRGGVLHAVHDDPGRARDGEEDLRRDQRQPEHLHLRLRRSRHQRLYPLGSHRRPVGT